jgi:hypothetical protein
MNKQRLMKNNKKEKSFDTVKTFREIKEKIAQDLVGMNFEKIKAYFKANSLRFQQQ